MAPRLSFLRIFSFFLKGLSFYSDLLSLQLVLCHTAAIKSLPALMFCADYILLLVLCDQRMYSEGSKKVIRLDSFSKQI